MSYPPFGIPECDRPPEEVQRTTAASTRGNTLQQYSPPVASLSIHYESQFRFIQFYTVPAQLPYWFNTGDAPMSQDALTTAMQSQPAGWLPEKDRFVHLDDEKLENGRRVVIPTNYTVKVGKASLHMLMGESKHVSDGERRLIWVPQYGTLPTHISPKNGSRILKQLAVQTGGPVPRQWGIRTSMELEIDPCGEQPTVHSYKGVIVWERWNFEGSIGYTQGMAILPASTDPNSPAIFAGYPCAMGNQSSLEQMEEYPAIQIRHEWAETPPPQHILRPPRGTAPIAAQNPDGPGWLSSVRGWSLKNPNSWKATRSICIHTGNQPNWFLGCHGPGMAAEQTEWGFTTKNHSRETMWGILGRLGVSRQQFKTQGTSPSGRFIRWIVIYATAHPDAVVDDGWKRQSIWLHEPSTEFEFLQPAERPAPSDSESEAPANTSV